MGPGKDSRPNIKPQLVLEQKLLLKGCQHVFMCVAGAGSNRVPELLHYSLTRWRMTDTLKSAAKLRNVLLQPGARFPLHLILGWERLM